MNYIFAISGADDEVYAVVCHEIENESWYTPKEEELITRWMNYNYGTFEEAVNLINEGEIQYIITDFSNFSKCPRFFYYKSFEERNILYYESISDLIRDYKDSYICYYDNDKERWVKI